MSPPFTQLKAYLASGLAKRVASCIVEKRAVERINHEEMPNVPFYAMRVCCGVYDKIRPMQINL
jgi:hypothetical protein